MTLIINKPSLAPLPHRLGWSFFTAVFWIVFIYLWMPVITLLMWALGIHAFDHFFIPHQDNSTNVFKLKHVALIYLTIIAVFGAALLMWARVQYLRFRNVKRRAEPPTATQHELAHHAELNVINISTWQAARRVVAEHDEHGRLLHAQVSR